MEGLPAPPQAVEELQTAPPRKANSHAVLSAQQKRHLCCLKLANPKLTQSKLIEHAKELFNITPSMSQINRMLIGKDEFLRLRQEDGDRKRNRGAKWPELEKAVDMWYNMVGPFHAHDDLFGPVALSSARGWHPASPDKGIKARLGDCPSRYHDLRRFGLNRSPSAPQKNFLVPTSKIGGTMASHLPAGPAFYSHSVLRGHNFRLHVRLSLEKKK